jgi:hypothetical protein
MERKTEAPRKPGVRREPGLLERIAAVQSRLSRRWPIAVRVRARASDAAEKEPRPVLFRRERRAGLSATL